MSRSPRRLVIAKGVYKALQRLDQPERKRLVAAISALEGNPYPKGKRVKRLKGPADEFLCLRVGDYRVIYEVVGDEARVLGLVHRRDLEGWIKEL